MKTTRLYKFISVLLFGIPFVTKAQNTDIHSLSKYSYPIFTVTGTQQNTGTAFFYRSGDTSYLVSNYHAIKGMNPVHQTIAFSTDTLYLKYPVKHSKDTRLLELNVGEDVTRKTEVFSMVNRIDLLKIPVNIPTDAVIHYINDLIEENYFDAEPEQVFAFGYPTKPGSIPAFYSRQQRLEGVINANGFADYDASLKVNYPDASDSARAIMNGTARYYYFIKPFALQGYSGAPVFGKFKNDNDETIYRFIGVIFAGQPATRQTWAIKGAVALQYLQGEL